jgi:hypothetical protein
MRNKFLLGILVGQLLMYPYIRYLQNTPTIEAQVIPSLFYDFNETHHLQIKHLHNQYHLGGDTLNIYIASQENVNAEHHREFPNDDVIVEGFYNEMTNTIYCVYDPLVLHHEIRHVTEGSYHR